MLFTVEIEVPRGTREIVGTCGREGCAGTLASIELPELGYGQEHRKGLGCPVCKARTLFVVVCSAVAKEIKCRRLCREEMRVSTIGGRLPTVWTHLPEPAETYEFRDAFGRDLQAWDELLLEDNSTILVGDVNELRGQCDCCPYRGKKIVATRRWIERTNEGRE